MPAASAVAAVEEVWKGLGRLCHPAEAIPGRSPRRCGTPIPTPSKQIIPAAGRTLL